MRFLLVTLITCVLFSSALAANYPPTPRGLRGYWESNEPKGKRQFRMLPYTAEKEVGSHAHLEFPNGLYADSDSRRPLWSVDFFEDSICWAGSDEPRAYFPLYISRDCRYLARLTSSANSGADTVLRFYENGKLTKSYTLAEILAPERVEDATREEVWFKEASFGRAGSDDLAITTHLLEFGGETIRFRLSSGEIASRDTFTIASKSGWQFITLVAGSFLTGILFFVLVFWRVARPPVIVPPKQ